MTALETDPVGTMRDWLLRLLALFDRIDDGEPCRIAPDGGCQTHSGASPCEIAELRLLVHEIGSTLTDGDVPGPFVVAYTNGSGVPISIFPMFPGQEGTVYPALSGARLHAAAERERLYGLRLEMSTRVYRLVPVPEA